MGGISMVESTRQVQSRDPFDRFDEAVNDPRLYETYERADLSPYGRMDLAPYERTERPDLAPVVSSHEPVPLFLSDYEDDRYQDGPDYTFGKQKPLRSPFRVSRILFAVAALAAAAGGAALYSMDSTRSAPPSSTPGHRLRGGPQSIRRHAARGRAAAAARRRGFAGNAGSSGNRSG